METKETLREATRHLAEIEKQLNELVQDLKKRQERLREDSSLLKSLTVRFPFRSMTHKRSPN
jgi:hypothetical protein